MAISALGSRADSDARGAPRPAVLWAIALAGILAAAGAVGLALTSNDPGEEPALHAALLDWAALPYILAGLIAWRWRPDSRLGPLMIAVGFLGFVPTLAWANAAVPITIGEAVDGLPPVLFLHVFLAFPSGRLERPLERGVVAAGYVAALGLQLVAIALGGSGPDNLLAVVEEPGAAETLLRVQLVAVGVLALAGIGVLAARRRGAGRPLRRSVALLVDSFALALVMIAALSLTAAFEAAVFEGPAFEWIRRATFVVIGIAPVAFLLGLLNARLARSAVGDLLIELRAEPAPADLRDAFARALGDPSLTLAYWLPQFGSWADPHGRQVELPKPNSGRATTLVETDGAHVAALVHDASLRQEPELLDAVSAAAAIALENGRLHSELNARLEELRGSRARVIEAGQKERQRLERNLHDGAQQRLVALSLELGLLEDRFATDPDARARVSQARQEVALSLEELRDVARGLHPALLSGHGLAVALEALADHAPLPVRLRVALEGRLPGQVEAAAYYVVAESLANIGKHAQATSASIDVARANGQVVVEILDDGVGGADPERGSGLRGLADRVEALSGGLRVWTQKGGGTRVRAEIPCA
jgi:signal transduction histidine kinase